MGAQLPTRFPWLPEDDGCLGLRRSRRCGPEAGLGCGGCLTSPPQATPGAQGSREGSASSAGAAWPVGGGGMGPQERNKRGNNALRCHSLNSPRVCLPRTGVGVHGGNVQGGGGERGGGTAIARTLSPGQPAPWLWRPFCVVWAAGAKAGMSSDPSPSGGPGAAAGRSRASLSGHWGGDSEWLVSSQPGPGWPPPLLPKHPAVAGAQGQAPARTREQVRGGGGACVFPDRPPRPLQPGPLSWGCPRSRPGSGRRAAARSSNGPVPWRSSSGRSGERGGGESERRRGQGRVVARPFMARTRRGRQGVSPGT